MSVKVASMYAEISVDSTKLNQGLNSAKGSLSSFGGETGKMIGSLVGITSAAAIAGVAIKKTFDFMKESTLVAARVEEMNAVLGVLGERAGMGSIAIKRQTEAIKDLGITTSVAQTVMAQFIRYNLDMSQSTDLARVAQDAAVISMQDSSQALDGLIYGITTFNPKILRTYGIVVDSNQVFEKYALTLGKNADELSGAEKQQAYLNAVIENGSSIAGAYDAAMGTAGKQLRSFSRYVTDLKEELGKPLQDEFSNSLDSAKSFVQGLTYLAKKQNDLNYARSIGIKISEEEARQMHYAASGGQAYADIQERIIQQENMIAEMEGRAAYDAKAHGAAVQGLTADLEAQAAAQEAAAKATDDYYSSVIGMVPRIQDLKDRLGEARVKYEELLKNKPWDTEALDTAKGQVEELEAAVKRQTLEFITNMLLQKLSVDGLTEAEGEFVLNYMESTGQIDAETRKQASYIMRVSNGLSNIPKTVEVGINIRETYFESGKNNYRGRDKEGFASGGSFKGWGMVGDSKSGGITPYTEWVYAPHGATVYNQSQMSGKSAPPMANGGIIKPTEDMIYLGPSASEIGEAVGNTLMQLGAV